MTKATEAGKVFISAGHYIHTLSVQRSGFTAAGNMNTFSVRSIHAISTDCKAKTGGKQGSQDLLLEKGLLAHLLNE